MAEAVRELVGAERDDVPLYNSRITQNYVRLIRSRYPWIDIKDVLAYAGMEPGQVEDEGHWFTQRQVHRFHERLAQVSGNPSIAREAGRFAASPESLGRIRPYIMGLANPARTYAAIGSYSNKLTRSTVFACRRTGATSVEVTVTPREDVQEERFQCENRLGFLEAIADAFDHRLPKIEHPECRMKGAPHCRYLISWQPSRAAVWNRIRTAVSAVAVLVLAALPFLHPAGVLYAGALPVAASIFFALSWLVEHFRTKELSAAVKALEQGSIDLIEQDRLNYENALMVNEIGQTLNRKLEIDEVLSAVTEILRRRLDYDRGLILLADPAKTRLLIKGGFGYDARALEAVVRTGGFHLNPDTSHGIFTVSFWEKRPFLVNSLEEIRSTLSARSTAFAERMGVQSFICCPIVFEDEPLGLLAVDNMGSKRPLLTRDINLLMGIAPQIAVCIHNARLNENRWRQFQSILQVLVASTEARDPITAGHSAKVTDYSVGICRQLQLSPEYTEMIRVAALLHDYGKIGILDTILKKPGRLSAEEREEVKTHAAKSRDILGRIAFEGIYREVPEIVGAHHEKVDGTGYPNGLSGDEIPLGARILAVADVFEALTSKRHYRDPMQLHEAFDELVRDVGRHFDGRCVEALIAHYDAAVAPSGYSFEENRVRLAAGRQP